MKKLLIGLSTAIVTTTFLLGAMPFNKVETQDVTTTNVSNDSVAKVANDTNSTTQTKDNNVNTKANTEINNVVKSHSTIVTFNENQEMASLQNEYADFQVEQLYPGDNTKYVIAANSSEDYQTLTNQLKTDEHISNYENDIILTTSASATPNDSYYKQTINNAPYSTYQGSLKQSKIDLAWNTSTGDNQAVIAVIDTGSSIGQHADLNSSLAWTNTDEIANNNIDDDNNGYIDDINGYNFTNEGATNDLRDTTGHGSHVTSTIGESTDNYIGGAGINQNAQIMSLKVFSKNQGANLSTILQAEQYAINNGAKIVNMSLGGYYFSTEEYQLIKNNPDVLFVAAAGNDATTTVSHPAGYSASYTYNSKLYPGLSNVVAVGAADANYLSSDYSNYGSWVDIAAPGNNIFNSRCYWNSNDLYNSSVGNNDSRWTCAYSMLSGTSMATPTISGVASLIYATNPNLNATQVKSILTSTADHYNSLSNATRNNNFINAETAVLKAQELNNVNFDSLTYSTQILNSSFANNLITITFNGKIYQDGVFLQNFANPPKVQLINKNTNAVVATLTTKKVENGMFTVSLSPGVLLAGNVYQLKVTPNEAGYYLLNEIKTINQAPVKQFALDLKNIGKMNQDGTFLKQKATFKYNSTFNNISKQLRNKFYVTANKTIIANTYNINFSLNLIRNEDNKLVNLTSLPAIQLVSSDQKSIITINAKNIYKGQNPGQYIVKVPENYFVNGKTYYLKFKVSDKEVFYQNLNSVQKNYTNLSANKQAIIYNFKDNKKVQYIPYKLATQIKVSLAK